MQTQERPRPQTRPAWPGALPALFALFGFVARRYQRQLSRPAKRKIESRELPCMARVRIPASPVPDEIDAVPRIADHAAAIPHFELNVFLRMSGRWQNDIQRIIPARGDFLLAQILILKKCERRPSFRRNAFNGERAGKLKAYHPFPIPPRLKL